MRSSITSIEKTLGLLYLISTIVGAVLICFAFAGYCAEVYRVLQLSLRHSEDMLYRLVSY